jgi:NADPH:quinone reductase-like Zn-dependent oxidoreductase
LPHLSTIQEVPMKALALLSFDDPPSVIDVPDPVVGLGEVLVEVTAASLNPYDAFVAMGAAKQYLPYEFPAVIGGDLAGTVEALGDGVDGFAVGDRVFGMMGMKGAVRDGSFAERTTPQAGSIARTPERLSDVDASTIGVAGTTAVSAIEALEPLEGAHVLIVGATGGVGSFAIQMAALRGATVIATVRPGDERFVTDLGASETVDYTGDLIATIRERYPEGVDAVIDAVGADADAFGQVTALVRKGGRAASTRGAAPGEEIDGVAVTNANGNPGHLGSLADLVANGKVRAAVTARYPLEDAAQALRDLSEQHTVGKKVITVG